MKREGMNTRTTKELPVVSPSASDDAGLNLITPDKFHDECAVFGIYGHKEAANLTYLGL